LNVNRGFCDGAQFCIAVKAMDCGGTGVMISLFYEQRQLAKQGFVIEERCSLLVTA